MRPCDIPQLHTSITHLADENWNKCGSVDILLGVREYTSLRVPTAPVLEGDFIIEETVFGWVVKGSHVGESMHYLYNRTCYHLGRLSNQDIHDDMRATFETHEIIPENFCKEAEDHFDNNVIETHDHRIQVRIPFKYAEADMPKLGNTSKQAVVRHFNTRKRLSADKTSELDRYFQEQLQDGIIEHASAYDPAEFENEGAILPLVVVEKKDAVTTKMRPCLDGSARGTNGFSINDLQHAGTKMQPQLEGRIQKMRIYKYAIGGDLKQMFLNIEIHPDDRKYCRFIWQHSDGTLHVYQYTRVLFGMTSSPFLAQKTLLYIAKKAETMLKYHAANALKHQFYIDDFNGSAPTISIAQDILEELMEVLEQAKFPLHKVYSNEPKCLDRLPADKRLVNLDHIDVGNKGELEEAVKILGMKYNAKRDIFYYAILALADRQTSLTLRVALSDAAKIFDPIGGITPVLIGFRVLIQKMWKYLQQLQPTSQNTENGAFWDEQLPSELRDEFQLLYSELPSLNNLQIQRYLRYQDGCTAKYMCFTDASQNSYGCVLYLYTVPENSTEAKLEFIGAKSKVIKLSKALAPENKKELTIPRAELQAAHLGVQYTQTIKTELNLRDDIETLFFTDSKVTLAWIRSGIPEKWLTFTANRLKDILTHSKPDDWHYVRTTQNPADFASRGMSPTAFMDAEVQSLWFFGPAALKKLPLDIESVEVKHTDLDIRPKFVKFSAALAIDEQQREFAIHLTTINRFGKLVRTIAYVFRFASAMKCKHVKISKPSTKIYKSASKAPLTKMVKTMEPITHSEIQKATKFVLQQHQQTELADVIHAVKHDQLLKSHPLAEFRPMIRNELLCIETRLPTKSTSPDEKYPFIIVSVSSARLREMKKEKPSRFPLIYILLLDAHHKTNHGNAATTKSYFCRAYYSQRYSWMVRDIIKNCVICIKVKGIPTKQLMGERLPEYNWIAPAFSFIGLDYAGPYDLTLTRKVHTKFYVVIIVCYSTHAIFLDMTTGYGTQDFLSAFTRFTATHGMPSSVTSDNQKAFVEAATLYKAKGRYDDTNVIGNATHKLFTSIQDTTILAFCTRKRTSLQFKS